MAIVFATKKEALEFLRGLKDYFEHDSGGVFSPRQYCRCNGEYSSPDYKPCHYKDGWGIKGIYYYYPGTLRLDVVGASLHDVIEATRKYQPHGEYLLRSPMGGRNICARTLTHRSITARKAAGIMADEGRTPPCLHEVRSLAERLYRAQGVDTKTLLGHKRQHMTDVYNDDRGLSDGQWRVLKLQ